MLPRDSEGVTPQHLSSYGKFQVELRVSIYRLLQRYVSRVGKLPVLVADYRLCRFRQRQKGERNECRLELHRLRGVSKTGSRWISRFYYCTYHFAPETYRCDVDHHPNLVPRLLHTDVHSAQQLPDRQLKRGKKLIFCIHAP